LIPEDLTEVVENIPDENKMIKIEIEGELENIDSSKYKHLLGLSKFYLYLWTNQKVISKTNTYVINDKIVVLGKIENGEETIQTMFQREHSNWDIHTFENTEETLNNLILSYKGDFAKHPIMTNVAKIGEVFNSLPAQLARENKKFIYQLIRTGARAREYEDAIQWLINAGLVYQVKLNTKPSLPLSAYDDQSAFKLYALDVGIIRNLAKLSPSVFLEGNRLFSEFKGALIENYILQSLVAQLKTPPRYWTSGNTAEVDFLIQIENEIIPIEVKSDENVKSRSLSLYNEKFNPSLRIRYSLKNLQYRDGLLNIPLFLADYTIEMIRRVK
jgi:hypothetical protein